MKKIVSLLLCILFLGGCSASNIKSTEEKEMTLDIVVENQQTDEILYEGKCTSVTSGNTLADFLEGAKDLEVEMEDGSYGKTIISILGLKTEDWNKGPWWTYSSNTNKTCQEAGYCPACSELEIKENDSFVFTYSSEY